MILKRFFIIYKRYIIAEGNKEKMEEYGKEKIGEEGMKKREVKIIMCILLIKANNVLLLPRYMIHIPEV